MVATEKDRQLWKLKHPLAQSLKADVSLGYAQTWLKDIWGLRGQILHHEHE